MLSDVSRGAAVVGIPALWWQMLAGSSTRSFLGQLNHGARQAASTKHLKREACLASDFPCNGPEKPEPEFLEIVTGRL